MNSFARTTDRHSSSMHSRRSIYDDCCLIQRQNLNTTRFCALLARRLKSNSSKTSFDFKSLRPEQPSANSKVSRSLLRFYPRVPKAEDLDAQNASSASSDDEAECVHVPSSSTKLPTVAADDDDYLNALAQWQPIQSQITVESDDDEEVERLETTYTIATEPLQGTSPFHIRAADAEEILVTAIYVPVKHEPVMSDDCIGMLSQLDGQTDLLLHGDYDQQRMKDDTMRAINNIITQVKDSCRSSSIVPPARFHLGEKKGNPHRSHSHVPVLSNGQCKSKTKPPLLSSFLKTEGNKSPSLKPNIKHDAAIRHHRLIPLIQEKSIWKYMIVPRPKLSDVSEPRRSLHSKSSSRRPQICAFSSPNKPQKRSKSIDSQEESNPKWAKTAHAESKYPFGSEQRCSVQSKRKSAVVQPGRTLMDYFDANRCESGALRHSSPIPRTRGPLKSFQREIDARRTMKRRSMNFFNGCIVVDDDDNSGRHEQNEIEEIQPQRRFMLRNTRAREKLLDHATHLSMMRIQWLHSLELVLLEHISICQRKNIPSTNARTVKCNHPASSSSYPIDPSFVSTVVLNCLRMFIIRDSTPIRDELAFFQFGLTSHLRHLLLDLPSFNHDDEETCSSCQQYASILAPLFDLLFDLLEFDLCERTSTEKYRSSLIEDDYFHRHLQSSLNGNGKFSRINFVVYLIELIATHRNKCPNKSAFSFDEKKIFQWIEEILEQLVQQQADSLNHERFAVCFNVMELCLCFVKDREIRIEQMVRLLIKLVQEQPARLHLFLFEKNLFVDIRLLFINELFYRYYRVKFSSLDQIEQFFRHVQMLNLSDSIDERRLLMIRSLFDAYADYVVDNQHAWMSPTLPSPITSSLRYHLESIRTATLFRLLQFKWNRL